MDDRVERSGLIGVGFLFAYIGLFLLVACLKASGHPTESTACWLAGEALLAGSTAGFLLRSWRGAKNPSEFHENGDVQFSLAVFLLALIALFFRLSQGSPYAALLIFAAALPARYCWGRLVSR